MIGDRLGPYEITARLGEGGMGEVWRAKDTRLDRDVAIKVLPEAFTEDKERLARFEREAKVLAQLQHPNIASIYGMEESGTTRALVMELVEGPTLADRLAQGGLSLSESLSIARQIAEALEEAHEKGIVHRDLKPQNVKASNEGKVKVLDFGLAKAMDAGASASGGPVTASPTLLNSPTLTAAGTQLGVILGTAAYMAPEQARGVGVDKRADIWAFGVVLYEMLSGQRLFEGELVTDVLANVLKKDVDLAALPDETPPALRRLLRRCLERDPRRRLRDIGDARLVLDEIASGASEDGRAVAASPEVVPAPAWKRSLPWIVTALGVALGIAGLSLAWRGAPPKTASLPTTRFTVFPSSPGEIDGYPALSPDGRTLVFGLIPDRGIASLWLHSFDSGESRQLPGTEYAEQPFWSPDGRHVGFFAAGELRRIEVATGLVQSVARVSDPRGGCWSESGEIFFSPTSAASVSAVPAAGGEARPLTRLGTGEQSHRYPWALPGGKAVLFSTFTGKEAGIYWYSLETQERKYLLPDVSRAAYDPRGFLLWVRRGALVAQRFDPGRGALSGEISVVTEQVGVDPQKTGQDYYALASGNVAYRVGEYLQSQLRWFDRQGAPAGEVTSAGNLMEPVLSADDSRVVVGLAADGRDAQRDMWVFDTSSKDRGVRLSFEGNRSTPIWSRDGRSVFYSRDVGDGYQIVSKRADGSGAEELIYSSPTPIWPDGQSSREPLLVLEGSDAQGGYRLWLLPLEGDRSPRPFQQSSSGSQAHASLSPDGRLLAYTSDESGLAQVYVQPVEGSGVRWQVSSTGGDFGVWRSDGTELYYVGLDRVLRAVPIRSLEPFVVGAQEELFPLNIPPIAVTSSRSQYAPSRDGQRFLVNDILRGANEPGIQVILGWSPPVSSAPGAGQP